jgi:hypothetical protein
MKQIDTKFDYTKCKTVSKKTFALCEKILNKKNKLLASIPWGFELTTHDKSLMKNKNVKKYLKQCEKLIQAEIEKRSDKLIVIL